MLVIYREDHSFLLDQVIPKPRRHATPTTTWSSPRSPIARAPRSSSRRKRVSRRWRVRLGPGGRLIAIHSHGNDPGMEIVHKVWPDDNPFTTAATTCSRQSKPELGAAGRDLNFNAYSDERSLFRYDMHTLPTEIASSIGTSTLFAAWNAAIYVAQIEDERPVRRAAATAAISRRRATCCSSTAACGSTTNPSSISRRE